VGGVVGGVNDAVEVLNEQFLPSIRVCGSAADALQVGAFDSVVARRAAQGVVDFHVLLPLKWLNGKVFFPIKSSNANNVACATMFRNNQAALILGRTWERVL
jgi:hypothetical protein